MIFGVWGKKILIFGDPGTENTDVWCPEREKIDFDLKILIFNAPEAPTKGGDLSTCQNPPESIEKPWFWGVRRRAGTVPRGILDPLKH